MSEARSATSPRLQPAALRPHYQQFLQRRDACSDGSTMPRRILLTGHSHQAWPDVARAALLQCFDDAALHVDDKWGAAFAAVDAVRTALVDRIGGRKDEYAFGSSTHELVARFLSGLDLRRRRHIVTTSGEFHSLHRQLRRLAEEGIEVTWVPTQPVATLAGRMARALRPNTAAVMASTVLFETSEVVPHLSGLTLAAHQVGASVLYDAYHAFSVLPFSLAALGPDPIFLTAGGYKYAQWGEGVCFLRVPPGTAMRPLYTGWFAAFASLSDRRTDSAVPYPDPGAWRFAGSTFDPASFYRARAVCRFFDEQRLTVPALRQLSLHQTERLRQRLLDAPRRPQQAAMQLVTPSDPSAHGGFLTLRIAQADRVVDALRQQGVYVDSRGDLLRIGPAPYVLDEELDLAVDLLRDALTARR